MKSGQRIQMTVNLIDGATLRTLGSTVVTDRAGDFSSLEDQAVRQLAELMKLTGTPDTQVTGRAPPCLRHTNICEGYWAAHSL